jgi:hypothetical protein
MKTAIVHDWLTGMRGGEKVLEALCERYPDAELFTLLHVRGSVSAIIERVPVHHSLLQYLPGVRRYYRRCLPLFPVLVEQFDLEGSIWSSAAAIASPNRSSSAEGPRPLLPHADALRVDQLTPTSDRNGWVGSAARLHGRCWRLAPGPRHGRRVTAMSRTPTCCAADRPIIIARPAWYIRPLIQIFQTDPSVPRNERLSDRVRAGSV